jgi:hypothetical protein
MVQSSGPTKAEQIIEVALCANCVVVTIALAAWQHSVILMIFAGAVAVLLAFSLMRSRKLGEDEMTRRQDKAMGKATDDPREIARWVP